MKLTKVLLSSIFASLGLASTASAITVYGLGTDNGLYSFDSASPGTLTSIGAISVAGIVDIDFHAANGKLYGMTSTGSAYGIDTTTGLATLLVTPGTSLSGVQNFDFNPAADRIRISAVGGANFRMVPDFITAPSATGVSGTVLNDGVFSGAGSTTILSLAYNNAFDTPASASATHATTLFSIGSDGLLYTHSTGSGAAGSFGVMAPIGSLGFNPVGAVGFDISGDNQAFVSANGSLYSLNLSTGLASSLGAVSSPLRSIAIVPEASTFGLAALAGLAGLRRSRRA